MNNCKEKSCEWCSVTFKPRAPNQKYHSLKCEKLAKQRKCKYCSKPFLPKQKVQRFCSPKCGWVARRRRPGNGMLHCSICKKKKAAKEFRPWAIRRGIGRCILCDRMKANREARTTHGRYKYLEKSARRRSLEMTITESQYKDIISFGRCAYCSDSFSETGTALDRKDNAKGYTLDNVVPCCGECNRIRMDWLSHEEMLMLSPTLREIKIIRKQQQTERMVPICA